MTKLLRTRRRFIADAALMTVAAPFVHALDARAETAPKRLVLLFSGNGHRKGQWATRRTDNDFDLLRITAPLAPYKAQMILFEGLDMHATRRSTFNTVKHGLGSGSAFTGTGVMDDGWPNGPSIDQMLAAQIGNASPLRSLHLAAACYDTNVYGRVSYAAGSKPVVPEQVPQTAYSRLFAPLLERVGASSPDLVAQRLARRQSVLDSVRTNVCNLAAAVGAEDRRKLEAHCEAIRNLESSLSKPVSTPANAAVCPKLQDLSRNSTNNETYEKNLTDHIALVRLALACRLTRVVTLQMGQASGAIVARETLSAVTHHHNASHWKTSGGGEEAYIRISTWYSKRVADLAKGLMDVKEDNGSLLDNTAVLWATDVNDGEEHGDEDVPWVVLGGKNLGLRGGRMLSVKGRHHNELLLSLAQRAGGSAIERIGPADLCPGPLELG